MLISKMILTIIKFAHTKLEYSRRTRVLSSLITTLIPENARVLDVGCGDGDIDEQILKKRQDITIEGIDILMRNKTKIPVTLFNGRDIPFPDNSFDCILFIDVLHHTEEPDMLIEEANRASKKYIIIKDHRATSKLDHYILRFMDWVGNKPHGVVLVYNYLPVVIWKKLWEKYQLKICTYIAKLDLYPWPFTFVFDGSKQFIVKLEKAEIQ